MRVQHVLRQRVRFPSIIATAFAVAVADMLLAKVLRSHLPRATAPGSPNDGVANASPAQSHWLYPNSAPLELIAYAACIVVSICNFLICGMLGVFSRVPGLPQLAGTMMLACAMDVVGFGGLWVGACEPFIGYRPFVKMQPVCFWAKQIVRHLTHVLVLKDSTRHLRRLKCDDHRAQPEGVMQLSVREVVRSVAMHVAIPLVSLLPSIPATVLFSVFVFGAGKEILGAGSEFFGVELKFSSVADRKVRKSVQFIVSVPIVACLVLVCAHGSLPLFLASMEPVLRISTLLAVAVADFTSSNIVLMQRTTALDEQSKLESDLAQQRTAAQSRQSYIRYVFHEARVHLHSATMGLDVIDEDIKHIVGEVKRSAVLSRSAASEADGDHGVVTGVNHSVSDISQRELRQESGERFHPPLHRLSPLLQPLNQRPLIPAAADCDGPSARTAAAGAAPSPRLPNISLARLVGDVSNSEDVVPDAGVSPTGQIERLLAATAASCVEPPASTAAVPIPTPLHWSPVRTPSSGGDQPESKPLMPLAEPVDAGAAASITTDTPDFNLPAHASPSPSPLEGPQSSIPIVRQLEALRVVVASVRDGADSMAGVFNGVLTMAAIEAGAFKIDRLPCSLAVILNHCVQQMRPWAAKCKTALRLELDDRLPASSMLDEQRIGAAVANFVSNALKNLKAGSTITVRAALVGLEEAETAIAGAADGWHLRETDKTIECGAAQSNSCGGVGAARESSDGSTGPIVRVEVIDNGPGIPAAQQKRLFKTFSQVEHAAGADAAKALGSSGLGLSITAEVITQHGGDVGVRSSPGQGSTFWFQIPLEASPPTPAAVPGLSISAAEFGSAPPTIAPNTSRSTSRRSSFGANDLPSGLRIMVVDDSDSTRLMVVRALSNKLRDPTILGAEDGLKALQLFSDRSGAVDVVLMDRNMPVMDGIEATRALRSGRYQLSPAASPEGAAAATSFSCTSTAEGHRADVDAGERTAETAPKSLVAQSSAFDANGLRRRAAQNSSHGDSRLLSSPSPVITAAQQRTRAAAAPGTATTPSGLDAVASTQAVPFPAFSGLIIGLTGDALGEEVTSFHDAGVDVVLAKPASAADILDAMRQFLHRLACTTTKTGSTQVG